MATSIEWTATVHPDGRVTPGSTWNPVTGCSKVSPGCAHCYAERLAPKVFAGQTVPDVEHAISDRDGGVEESHGTRKRLFTDVRCHEDRLDAPLRWRKPRRVFVNSMSDLFHEDVPDAFIDRVLAVMALAPQHTFQILTKRAERMKAYFDVKNLEDLLTRWADAAITIEPLGDGEDATEEAASRYEDVFSADWPLPNVWLGVSVENQHFADERIPLLLQTPAAVRFISAEPLLGPVDLSDPLSGYPEQISERSYVTREMAIDAGDRTLEGSIYDEEEWQPTAPALNWVIVGGESGPGARPFDLAWARSIVQQCQAAGVPVFIKQLGAKPRGLVEYDATPFDGDADTMTEPIHLADRKGGDPEEWPADLRVRQFPEAR